MEKQTNSTPPKVAELEKLNARLLWHVKVTRNIVQFMMCLIGSIMAE